MRFGCSLLLFCALLARADAAGSPLLNRAAAKWLAEGNRWAFTMQVRKIAGNSAVKEVRVERYDPSKPGPGRWELVTVDGRPPTEERRAAWAKAKARTLREAPKSFAGFLDLENATVAGFTSRTVSYLVPMRSDHSWLLPMEQVALTVTVNKATHAIERVEAGLNAPFRVVLGLARVLDVDFDLKIYPTKPPGADAGPATAHPAGVAQVVVGRLGERLEYTWSDFRRVPAFPEKPGAADPKN